MRDRFTVLIGLVAIACGVLWMIGLATALHIPWEWVLPASLVAIGAILVFGRSDPGNGAPPSQFERDDAPRVP